MTYEGTAKAIIAVTAEDVMRWSEAIGARSEDDFVLTDEHERVCEFLGLGVSGEGRGRRLLRSEYRHAVAGQHPVDLLEAP